MKTCASPQVVNMICEGKSNIWCDCMNESCVCVLQEEGAKRWMVNIFYGVVCKKKNKNPLHNDDRLLSQSQQVRINLGTSIS